MILVDTSVWIDFFAGRDLRHIANLEQSILYNEDLALSGIILTESLQGIPGDTTYRRARRYLSVLIMLPIPKSVFFRAMELYRKRRKQGITIRKTNDCIIAATALEHQYQLLHSDKDFAPITKHYPLKIIKT